MDDRLAYAQEDLLKHFESMYEAIMVMSQRARQIGNSQMQTISQLQKQYAQADVMRENVADDEFDLSEPRDPIELPKLPKPTIAAIHEAVDQKIDWHYEEPKTEEEQPFLSASEIENAIREATAKREG